MGSRDLQDGLLTFYNAQAMSADFNVEAEIERDPVNYVEVDTSPEIEALTPVRACNVVSNITRNDSWAASLILTMNDMRKIADMSRRELSRVPHCGKKTIRDIEEWLARHGMKLREDG